MIKEEELYKVIENLNERVQRLEQENQEFKRIQDIFQHEVEDMRIKNFHLNMKFMILGIQQNWFEPSSLEYQEYSDEQIQKYNQKYHFNPELFQKRKKPIEKKTQAERLELL